MPINIFLYTWECKQRLVARDKTGEVEYDYISCSQLFSLKMLSHMKITWRGFRRKMNNFRIYIFIQQLPGNKKTRHLK